jgi:CRISPR system Cascade subunit CasD
MKNYLLFRLYGPLASWGDIAVGVNRPSYDHPSKSAIMGLLAAALGIRRDEDEKHQELSESYNFAVAVHSSGNFLRDYHTVQVPSASAIKNQKYILTRKEELGVDNDELSTILSSRDYYCDSYYTVMIWARNVEFPYSLELIGKKLREPEFVLYLGRKSCPPSLPFEAKIVSGENLEEVIKKAEFKCQEFLSLLKIPSQVRLYWEGNESDLEPVHTIIRRDHITSRKRWQFADRKENYMVLELGE